MDNPTRLVILILAGILGCATARQLNAAIATDRAQVVVTPLQPRPGAPVNWTTIYDYHGGALPPGTRIDLYGRWVDPVMRLENAGLTIAFPKIPSTGTQLVQWAYRIERPLANYRTRLTVSYTQHFDKSVSTKPLTPFEHIAINLWSTHRDRIFKAGGDGAKRLSGLKTSGDNTIVYEYDGSHIYSLNINGAPVADSELIKTLPESGAALTLETVISNVVMQLAGAGGDIVTIHGVKIEQMRPELAASSVASIDLTVLGNEPSRVSLEVVDAGNIAIGAVLKDALVSPGTYRLYWDGLETASQAVHLTRTIAAGKYSFRLATSGIKLTRMGDINNSTPPFQPRSYSLCACSALAMMPPGMAAPMRIDFGDKWYASECVADPHPVDTRDSVMLTCVGYDANLGNWIGRDGQPLASRIDDFDCQRGRGVAVGPPDPAAPDDRSRQVMYVSQSIGNVPGIVAVNLAKEGNGTTGKRKAMTGVDWNHPPAEFEPYHIRIGDLPGFLGQENYLVFQFPPEWEVIVRNVRVYEEGSSAPPAMTFEADLFEDRPGPGKKTPGIPAGDVAIEESGTTVHLKYGSLTYPLAYRVTSKSRWDFELKIVKRGKIDRGGGLGMDSKQQPWNSYVLEEIRTDNVLNLLTQDARGGVYAPAAGGHVYPTYSPGALYPKNIVPPAMDDEGDYKLLWLPGYYGLKLSEDGKLLFACNNADHRIEVRDVGADGGLVAELPLEYPMFLDLGPADAQGLRMVFITSPKLGLVRVTWSSATRAFGKPQTLVPAAEFAYPRGIACDAVHGRLFVCDAFTPDRSKAANQIVVVDSNSGKILSRYGKPGGVDPAKGGELGDDVFTCPLTVAADSVGDIWVNDYLSGQVLKFRVDPGMQKFSVLQRVFGPNTTNVSHFYLLPGESPTQAWSVAQRLVRTTGDIAVDGRLTNLRVTGIAEPQISNGLRPYARFVRFHGRTFFTYWQAKSAYDSTGRAQIGRVPPADKDFNGAIFELAGTNVIRRVTFGPRAGFAAVMGGLLNNDAAHPSALEQSVIALKDPKWRYRPWVWSDVNGNGRMDFDAADPEFKIAYNFTLRPNLWMANSPVTSLRESDGAFLAPTDQGVYALMPSIVNGELSYDWNQNKLLLPRDAMIRTPAVDIAADDKQTYVLYNGGMRGDWKLELPQALSAYGADGTRRWTRLRDLSFMIHLQPMGEGLISVMHLDAQNGNYGPIEVLTADGDTVFRLPLDSPGDCWGHSAIRADADTAYIGWVNVNKLTGLATIRTASAPVDLSAALTPQN